MRRKPSSKVNIEDAITEATEKLKARSASFLGVTFVWTRPPSFDKIFGCDVIQEGGGGKDKTFYDVRP